VTINGMNAVPNFPAEEHNPNPKDLMTVGKTSDVKVIRIYPKIVILNFTSYYKHNK
jgi:hypothetical protein